MWQIFTGSLLLSLIHAAIPNHWIPLITIGKTEKWTQGQVMSATIITGFAHTLSTVLIGIIVGLIGYKLSESYGIISDVVAPLILIILGAVYLLLDFRSSHHHHGEGGHSHGHFVPNTGKSGRRAILVSLSIAMFLTPCIEIEVYYFHAGTIGWIGIFTVSAVYVFSTVLLMLALVYLGSKGINRIKSHFLEHHEKVITGSILIILGVLALIFKF